MKKRARANGRELWIYRYEGASLLSFQNAMLQPAVMYDGVHAGPALVLHVSRASITRTRTAASAFMPTLAVAEKAQLMQSLKAPLRKVGEHKDERLKVNITNK